MATYNDITSALKKAHEAGDADSARKLAAVVRNIQAEYGDNVGLPDFGETEIPGTTPKEPEAGLMEKAGDVVQGIAEVPLTVATGAVGGTAGMVEGTLEGIAREILGGGFSTDPAIQMEAAKRIQQLAEKRAGQLTYAPRSETGQDILETVGEVTAPLIGVAPLAQTATLGQASRLAAPVVKAQAQQNIIQPAIAAAKTTTEKAAPIVKQAAAKVADTLKKAPSAEDDSLSAARVGLSKERENLAKELGFQGETGLTTGQKTGKRKDIRFEVEQSKTDLGDPIVQRYNKQNEQALRTIDTLYEKTGAELPEAAYRELGQTIDQALRNRLEVETRRARDLWAKADASPEADRVVPLDRKVRLLNEDLGIDQNTSVIDFVNSQPKGSKTHRFLDEARTQGEVNGVLIRNEDGTHAFNPNATVRQVQAWRKDLNAAMPSPTNATDADKRNLVMLKNLIDQTVDPEIGPMYRTAINATAKMKQGFTGSYLTKQLLETKRGTDTHAIALESVLKNILSDSTSVDDLRHLKRQLSKGQRLEKGEVPQAWKELQGQTIYHLKQIITNNTRKDDAGNLIISPDRLNKEITKLKNSQKLDYLFGKQGAEKIETLNEVIQILRSAPPGTINTSNTATVLASLLDGSILGSTGLPVPAGNVTRILISKAKDAKTKALIKKHLAGVVE